MAFRRSKLLILHKTKIISELAIGGQVLLGEGEKREI